ncbi:MAG TPA: serine/threonine-protein kinase [Tepidisphaeraceae bacterium]|jgi:serine/threonine protein kinase
MLEQGHRVGEYVLDRRIGVGRFGEVWLARHHVWYARVVAAKIPTDPDYLRLLQLEGRVLEDLGHPNIVRATALDPYAQTPYLITEYVDGCSLRPLVGRRLVGDPAVALAILRQVLTGLDHAHGRGVVHRDLKPENVLLHREVGPMGFDAPGLVKLCDFGLGRIIERSGASAPASIVMSGSLAGDGVGVVGTPGYIAPEVLEGAAADPLADVYAAGVLLFEMLTGERPAGAASLAAFNSPLAGELDGLFRRAYTRRGERFPSAAAFLDAVRPLCARAAVVGTAGAPDPPYGGSMPDVEAARREAEIAGARARAAAGEAERARQARAEGATRTRATAAETAPWPTAPDQRAAVTRRRRQIVHVASLISSAALWLAIVIANPLAGLAVGAFLLPIYVLIAKDKGKTLRAKGNWR